MTVLKPGEGKAMRRCIMQLSLAGTVAVFALGCGDDTPPPPTQPSTADLEAIDGQLTSNQIDAAEKAIKKLSRKHRGASELEYRAIRLLVRQVQAATMATGAKGNQKTFKAVTDDFLGTLCGKTGSYLRQNGEADPHYGVVKMVYEVTRANRGGRPCATDKASERPSSDEEKQDFFNRRTSLDEFVESLMVVNIEW